MIIRMMPHVRGVTSEQKHVLLAMQPHQECDAWAISKRILTLYQLEARGLIRMGCRGWVDASLTETGIALRWQLLGAPMVRLAAE